MMRRSNDGPIDSEADSKKIAEKTFTPAVRHFSAPKAVKDSSLE